MLNIENKDILHLHDGSDLSRNVSIQHDNEDQHNHFGGPAVNEDNPEEQLEDHVEDDNLDEDINEDALVDGGVHIVRDDESITDDNLDMFGQAAQQDESEDEYESADEYDEPIVNPVEDPVEDRRPPMVRRLDSNLDGPTWESTGTHMVSVMIVAEQAGVRMMKEYFEIEASKATPQYGFSKGLTLFGDKGYQAYKNELKVNLLGRCNIDMLSWKNLTRDIRKQALGYLMFLKRKRSGKMK